MNFFNRKPKQAPKVQIKVIHSTAMRMEQWRTSPELVEFAKRLIATPEFLTMLDILRNESPSNFGLAIGSSHDDQIAHAYKGTGYNLCLNNLEALATMDEHPELPEASFGPEPSQPLPPDAPTYSLPESRDKE